MRGKKAKAIRKAVEKGDEFNKRRYYQSLKDGHVIADEKRREYQKAKRGE